MNWKVLRRMVFGCAVVVVLFFVGTGILIRWLKDPRARNEALTLGDVRTVITAQRAWQTANGGYYEGNLTCLASPAPCIPGYPAGAPTFLDARLASQVPKDGYLRAFVPGPRPKKVDPRASSPSSVETWTYSARPVARGKTGYRSFFADQTGVVRATSEDRAANVSDPPIE